MYIYVGTYWNDVFDDIFPRNWSATGTMATGLIDGDSPFMHYDDLQFIQVA